jgi:hypothetical protein
LLKPAKYAKGTINLFHTYFAMATNEQTDQELNRPADATQLGADQAPATTPSDDAHDMSTVMADAERGRDDVATAPAEGANAQQGSDFDQQRRQGAAGNEHTTGAFGPGQGMGHADTSGDEDRGYDQSGYRGGLGASGGREDLSDRHFEEDQNPFTGGYGGSGAKRPDDAEDKNVGLDAAGPAQS